MGSKQRVLKIWFLKGNHRLLHTFIQKLWSKLCFVRFLKLFKKQLSNKPFFEVLKCSYYLPFSTCNNQQLDCIISYKYNSHCSPWSNP
jgi:hypothetical protein